MRICVLRSGKEYGPKHVQWLARQVPDLVCLSDVEVEGVPTIRLKHDWPGWWAKMELFRPDIEEDLLFFDLDTVVLGGIEQLESLERTTLLSDFYKPHLPASGLMLIKNRDKDRVWSDWMENPEAHMKRCVTREHWGDQGYLRDVLPCKRWQLELPNKIFSYKAHSLKTVPAGASVICFHGNPRPWDVKKSWIPEL